MVEIVLWKPLYYTSIGMFLLSLLLLPLNGTLSIIIILQLIALWSKIPGYVHFIFNKLAVNDLFTFIVAAYAGGLAGGVFGAFSVLFGRLFGVNEYLPYTFRAATALFVAGISTPIILGMTGGVSVASLFVFEGVMYFVYYALVLLFFRDEIGLEIAILPAVVFFDFFMNAAWLGIFGSAIDSLMINGLGSGWTFTVSAAIILGFAAVAKNGKKIASYVQAVMNKRAVSVATRTYCSKCLTVFDSDVRSAEPTIKVLKCEEHRKGDVWGARTQ